MKEDRIYIAAMDRKIQIIKKIATVNSTGEEVYTEQLIIEPWASKKTVKSNEEVEDKIVAINEHEYVIRFDPALNNEKLQHLFIRDDDQEYNVYAKNEMGRNRYIKLTAELRE